MKPLLKLCLSLLAASCACLALRAEPEKVPWVNTQLSIICWDAEMQLSYPGYEGDKPIVAPMKMRSQRMQYEGPANFVFSGAKSLDGEAIGPAIPMTDVSLIPGSPQQLLIIIPGPENSGLPYRTLVIDDSYEQFPPQSVRLINFTNHTFAGQLSKETFQLTPRAEAVVSPQSLKPPKFLAPFRLVRKIEDDNSWRPVKSTIFPLHQQMRLLVLLLQDPQRPFEVKFVLLRDETTPQKSTVESESEVATTQ
ncbi:hypothetical protein [Cerasicoccus maritimus]|uniref:hypothetical protein n=1 Tax=Cerasicoccus maritimus TaxID=490089 RepID=UPI0028526D50|nr:hypothetical protein [Cerasicoccus maritimus]